MKKVPKAVKPTGSVAGLRKALTRRRRDELVAIVMELASNDRRILGQLTSRFEVSTPPEELVGATRQAITDGALHQVKVAALDVAGFPGEAVMRWAERGHIAG